MPAEGSGAPLWWAAGALALLLPALALLTALIERSGPIRMRSWVEEAGGRIRSLYEDPVRFEVFKYFLNLFAKLAPLGLFATVALLAVRYGLARPWIWGLGVVAVLVATMELANRFVLVSDRERALHALTGLYRVALTLLTPLVVVVAPFVPRRAPAAPPGPAPEDGASEEEVEAFIDVGTREGILEPAERELVWGVVDFANTIVRSVMTPRVEMATAPAAATLEALAELFTSSSHSRLPLYGESRDHIVGILHIRDLLRALRSERPPAVAEMMTPPFFVPETKSLAELLRELQRRRQQMAIVVDEYGGTAGLVTVEDLVEEIVGEIADEKDKSGPTQEALADGSVRFDGRAAVDALEERFGFEREPGAYETVGGLVARAFGYLPRAGEGIDFGGLRFEVEKADARRILSVRVRRVEEEGASARG